MRMVARRPLDKVVSTAIAEVIEPTRTGIPMTGTQELTRGLLVRLEAKEGKGDDLAQFLEAGRALAEAETGTVTWYAFKVSDTEYGVFDTFETDAARQAHLDGAIPPALTEVAPDLLVSEPSIQPVDLIAAK
jgi:quinol monooxygenase YgiN